MFFNVFISVDDKVKLTADSFSYHADSHSLLYHVADVGWNEFHNVECEISVDRPLIYIKVKTLGLKND